MHFKLSFEGTDPTLNFLTLALIVSVIDQAES